MILQGPAAAIVTPSSQVVMAPQPTAYSVSFDLVAHTYTIIYGSGAPSQTVRSFSATIPANVQTAVENHCLRAIENDQGWTANSATVVTP